jgi:hypothetical protein
MLELARLDMQQTSTEGLVEAGSATHISEPNDQL